MSGFDPTLTVLIYASLVAFAAGLGALPQAVGKVLPRSLLGWANALAAGLMLGVAYALMTHGLPTRGAVVQGSAGAILGVLVARLAHLGSGTRGADLGHLDDVGPGYGYQVVLVSGMHAAHEGVAIGVAMLVSLPFGISMALALAAHKVAEGMVLTSLLTGRGARLPHAAALAVAVNANQVLAALVTFVVVGAIPSLLPWVLGLAVGALLFLVLAEVLPEAYGQAGSTSIALVTLLAMGMVVALGGAG